MRLVFYVIIFSISVHAQMRAKPVSGRSNQTCPYLLGENDKKDKELIEDALLEISNLSTLSKKCSGSLSNELDSIKMRMNNNMRSMNDMDDMGSMGGMYPSMGRSSAACDNYDIVYKKDLSIAEEMLDQGENALGLIPESFSECKKIIVGDNPYSPEPVGEITSQMRSDFNDCASDIFASLMIKKKIECKSKRDEDKIKIKRDAYINSMSNTAHEITNAINMVADNPECKGLSGSSVSKMINIGQGLAQSAKSYISLSNPLAGAGLGAVSSIINAGVNYFQKRNGINNMLSELEGIREYNMAQCQMLKLNDNVFSCQQRADEEYVRNNMIELCSNNSTDEDYTPVMQLKSATNQIKSIYDQLEPFKQAVRDAASEEDKKLAQNRLSEKAREVEEGALDGADAVAKALDSTVKTLDGNGEVKNVKMSDLLTDSISKMAEIFQDNNNPKWQEFKKNPDNRSFLRQFKEKSERLLPLISEHKKYTKFMNEFDWINGDYEELEKMRKSYSEKISPVAKNAISDLGIIDDLSMLKNEVYDSNDNISQKILKHQIATTRKQMALARFQNASNPTIAHNAKQIDLAHTALVNGLRPLHENRLKKDFESMVRNFNVTNSPTDRATMFDRDMLPLFKECILGMTGSWLGGDNGTSSSNSVMTPSKKSQFNKSCGFIYQNNCAQPFSASKKCLDSANTGPCVNNEFKAYYCKQKSRFNIVLQKAREEFLKNGTLCGNSIHKIKKGITPKNTQAKSPFNVGTEFSSNLKENNLCPELTEDRLGNRACASALPKSVYEDNHGIRIQKLEYPTGVIFEGELYGKKGFFFTNGSEVKFIEDNEIGKKETKALLDLDGHKYIIGLSKKGRSLNIHTKKDPFEAYQGKGAFFKNVFDKTSASEALSPMLETILGSIKNTPKKHNKEELLEAMLSCSLNGSENVANTAREILDRINPDSEKEKIKGGVIVQ